jgi:hypothetical protein
MHTYIRTFIHMTADFSHFHTSMRQQSTNTLKTFSIYGQYLVCMHTSMCFPTSSFLDGLWIYYGNGQECVIMLLFVFIFPCFFIFPCMNKWLLYSLVLLALVFACMPWWLELGFYATRHSSHVFLSVGATSLCMHGWLLYSLVCHDGYSVGFFHVCVYMCVLVCVISMRACIHIISLCQHIQGSHFSVKSSASQYVCMHIYIYTYDKTYNLHVCVLNTFVYIHAYVRMCA